MKVLFHISAILILLAASSCSGNKEREREVAELPDIAMEPVATDTVADTVALPEDPGLVIEGDSLTSILNYMRESAHREEYRNGIIPAIAEHSAEYARRLLENEYSRFIIVDKGRMKVILYDKYGQQEKIYGMCCAKSFGTKHEKGDSRTPEGFFTAEGIYDSTDWLFTDDDGKTSPKKGQFGPRFIRLRIPGTSQIGIHGTCAPWSIGGRSSHGCIRITNENILELVELTEIGMPVIVVPGKRDMKVNREEGHETVWIPTRHSATRPTIAEPAKADSVKTEPADTVAPEKQLQPDTVPPPAPADTLSRE